MLPQPAKNMVLAIVEISRIVRRQAARALVLTAALLAVAPAAQASQPIEVLQKSINDGLRILNDPCGQPADCQALRQERLRQVLYRDFDFAEFSKRVLAQKWPLFSEAQRREFVEVFSRFLSEHYLSRLQQHYTNEKVLLHGQTIIAPGRAVVKSGVVWMNREFAVEVRMHAPGGDWKIYDVTVIGFSAVQIYRTQFQHLMRTQSPAQVIALIKSQLAE
jgi:ABC-type transporter MlaC component